MALIAGSMSPRIAKTIDVVTREMQLATNSRDVFIRVSLRDRDARRSARDAQRGAKRRGLGAGRRALHNAESSSDSIRRSKQGQIPCVAR